MSNQEVAQMKAEMEKLIAENQKLKLDSTKRAVDGLGLKVSQKGAVSLYGLGRFPVTLYQEQWKKVLKISDKIEQFIKDNEGSLASKE